MPSVKPTVVILLSDKRSGSTLFQDELCRHPDVQTVNYSSHTYLETHHWLKGAVLLDKDASRFAGGKIYNGYGSKNNARTYLIDTIQGNCPEFVIPTDDEELVFKGWEALCDKFAQPVFFEKSPQFLAHWSSLDLILKWMKQTTYEVKLIGLVRNPLSVLYSAFELFHTNPSKRQYGWASIHRNMLKMFDQVDRSQFLLVRYETITAHPKEKFAEICEFIGIEPSEFVGNKANKDSLNKWKEDPYFYYTLSKEVKDLALSFGYSEDELDNEGKPLPPWSYRLRQYIRGRKILFLARLRDRVVKPIKIRLK